jgi:hypothetical protein
MKISSRLSSSEKAFAATTPHALPQGLPDQARGATLGRLAAFNEMGDGRGGKETGPISIRIWRRGDHYDVLVVPEAGYGPRYRSSEPLTAAPGAHPEELDCHPAGIGEALYAADPGGWPSSPSEPHW